MTRGSMAVFCRVMWEGDLAAMIVQVHPIVEARVQTLCGRPYPRHPRGCPNYGTKLGCPPRMSTFGTLYDLVAPVFAVVTEFDLASHIRRMRSVHPEWSDAQCRCLLYWQGKARAGLRREVLSFLEQHPGYQVEATPEALGVDVTRTLMDAGIFLEWPPRDVVRQVALAALPRRHKAVFTN